MSTVLIAVTTGIAGSVVTAIVSFLGRQAQSEFAEWTPRITQGIIDRAVSRLPEEKRDRMREEWAGRVYDTPGQVGKWTESLRYLRAARKMSPRPSRKSPTLKTLRRGMHVLVFELYGIKLDGTVIHATIKPLKFRGVALHALRLLMVPSLMTAVMIERTVQSVLKNRKD